jgi:hypothetical protein
MEKEAKTGRVALGGLVFAVIFYLATKTLNIFVFDNLAHSALLGFLAAGEIGFFIASKETWLKAHKDTADLFGNFFKKNGKKILDVAITIICILASIALVLSANIFYYQKIPAQESDFALMSFVIVAALLLLTSVLLMLSAILIGFVGDKGDRKLMLGISAAYLGLGVLSPLLMFLVYLIIRLYIFQFAGIVLLQFLAIYLFLSVLRLATISPIASVAIGGTLGGFCGYLMPGWEQMVLLPTFEASCLAGAIGGAGAYLAHKLGKTQAVILIHRLMLMNKLKI